MARLVLEGIAEYLVWLDLVTGLAILGNWFTIHLWFLTAEIQRKIDERDDLQGLS